VCPFHEDHNPSLSIDATRQLYKCFACQAGGNIFKFVQEYSKLPGQDELSFGQTVQFVSSKFGDGSIAFTPLSRNSRMSDQEWEHLQHKKERIILANAASAEFYIGALAEPFAGGARHHLISRGISAASIRKFAMGYAPDVYYGSLTKPPGRAWGEGGLVDHLRMLNFTASEIVEAGLAVETKKRSNGEKTDNSNSTNGELEQMPDFSSIMDRFRARLMVPIYDANGEKVIAFGGREILPPDQEFDISVPVNRVFKSPKYLNSPESTIFEKKRVLFGLHLAKQFVRDATSNIDASVLVVEGYMDAIALATAGFGNVVASMGTAISPAQLDLAARVAAQRGGQLILCFDADGAGISAVERLCSNGMLAETANKHVIDIAVAGLPAPVKDPAEFVEQRTQDGIDMPSIARDFKVEVIESAVDWTDWFIDRIVADYKRDVPRGASGSFSSTFERVANFLASSLGPSDRTKRAYEVAGRLATILAKERNSTEASSAVQIQLEADLVDLATRLADTKDAIQRRAESIVDFNLKSASETVSSISRGSGPSNDEDTAKMSYQALSTQYRNVSSIEKAKSRRQSGRVNRASTSTLRRLQEERLPRRMKLTRSRDPESITPHFAGFLFSHKSDNDWLGVEPKGKVSVGVSGRKATFLSQSALYLYLTDFTLHRGGAWFLDMMRFS
jgi:DNA primase